MKNFYAVSWTEAAKVSGYLMCNKIQFAVTYRHGPPERQCFALITPMTRNQLVNFRRWLEQVPIHVYVTDTAELLSNDSAENEIVAFSQRLKEGRI